MCLSFISVSISAPTFSWKGNGRRLPFSRMINKLIIVVNTAKKNGSVKLAMDAKPMKDQTYMHKLQESNLLEILESTA